MERADRIGQVHPAVAIDVSPEEDRGLGDSRPVLLPGTELGEELIDAQPLEPPERGPEVIQEALVFRRENGPG